MMCRRLLSLLSLATVAGCAPSPPPGSPVSEGWVAQVTASLEAREYAFVAGSQGLRAGNRAQGYGVEVDARGASLAGRDGGWTLTVGTHGVQGPPVLRGERVEQGSGPVRAWFTNGPEGLRQGWTVSEGGDSVAIDVRVDGAEVAVARDGGSAWLHLPDRTLRYEDLRAWDAVGVALVSRMEARDGSLRIVTETAGVVWPVTVDPVIVTPEWHVNGGSSNAFFGAAVSGVGDVNADGYEDILVGVPGAGSGGAVALYLGGPTGPSLIETWSAQPSVACNFGNSLARAGDLNGDGFDDFAVGDDCVTVSNQAGAGIVHVWYGQANPGTMPAVAPWTASASAASAATGRAIAGAGDVDGDGFADLLVGAPGYGAGGSALLFRGDAAGLGNLPAATLTEAQAGANFGHSVAGVGDVDGDGLGDVLIGAPMFDAPIAGVAAGRVSLFLGTGSSPPLSGPASWTASGAQAADMLGDSVAGPGDLDGDGYPDLAAGATGADDGALVNGGAVLVWLTPSGSPTLNPQTLRGIASFESFGEEVAGVGDVNGDGYADLGVGATGGDRYAVHFGGEGGVSASADFEQFGSAGSGAGPIAAAGDVDGDGIGDVIVGAAFENPDDSGAAWLYLGARGVPLSQRSFRGVGGQPGGRLGVAVAGVGDVNGDGYDDVLVGAHEWSNGQSGEGAAFLFLGKRAGLSAANPDWSAEGDSVGANFGEAVAGAGDVNGDGYADWLVGAPDFTPSALAGAGRVSLFLGSASVSGTTAAWQVAGAAANTRLGGALAGGGDLNGDGFADIAAGARLFSPTGANEGAVLVWLGGPSGPSTTPSFTRVATVAGAFLGTSVAFLGDVNGDGYSDLAAGAPGFSDGSLSTAGAVFVWHGSPLGLTQTPDWSWGAFTGNGYAAVGAALGGAGDVDGDGYDDLVVGAPQSSSLAATSGRAMLFVGGPSGLRAAPSWDASGASAGAQYGAAVAGVGDLNGDGRQDVAVGAPGAQGAGYVALYGGHPVGGLTSATIFEEVGNQAGASHGASLAAAGDVNGDGVPDLIGGAPFFDVTTNGDQGRFIVWTGNARDDRGLHPHPARLHATDPSGAVIAPWSRASQPDAFDVVALGARGSFGPMSLALEVETKPLGTPFNGSGTVTSAWSAIGPTIAPLTAPLTGLGADTALHWRARLRYHPAEARHQRWGPWVVGGAPGQNEGLHLRTGCALDTDSDGQCDPVDDDDDNDGSPDLDDCDDLDPTVFPGATELCDAIDSNCDLSIVDGFPDADLDGDPDCNDPDDDNDGSDDAADCAPFDPTRFPGNSEVCDGEDNDCDGVVPPDESDVDSDAARPCDGDCDDLSATTHPGASEVLDCADNDCDGAVPANEVADSDLDGSPACVDCDEANGAIHPGAPEICDGADSDCDGQLDTSGLVSGETDDDGDGFAECQGDCDDGQADQHPGAPETGDAVEDLNCDGVFGQGVDADGDGSAITDPVPDCDDNNPDRFPGNVEVCDGIDNDCDGLLGPGETADSDGDGFLACEDCSDANAAVHPGADEICDGLDSNCDGYVGPGDYDVDGDGVAVCAGDCDDDNSAIRPGVAEDCTNGVDDDCDDTSDEDTDNDADGVGACSGDCDDTDPDRYDGAEELCDGIDQDCDGDIDEEFDADGDGWADCGDGAPDCDDAAPTVHPGAPELCDDAIDNDCNPWTRPFVDGDGDGFAACPDGDCDDTSDAIAPGLPELCDGLDNDCDGVVDDGMDLDGDGLTSCTGDCDEEAPTVRAGFDEVCDDGLDNNCDRVIDEGCADDDDSAAPLDIVFPAGCVCDSRAVGSPGGGVVLLLLVAVTARRRVRR